MSRSYGTTKQSVLAHRRMKRSRSGERVIPRVISRRPRAGDIHPMGRSLILRLLRQIPEKYIYGLARVELRARAGEIGKPFGLYQPRDKAIYLYSLPTTWHLPSIGKGLLASLQQYYAQIEQKENEVIVHWPCEPILMLWFFLEIFAHELGHHYRNQYRSKRKISLRRLDKELVANLHARRIKELVFAAIEKKEHEQQESEPDK